MNQVRALIGCCCGAICLALVGCTTSRVADPPESTLAHYQSVATQIEYPAVGLCEESLADTPPPRTIRDLAHVQFHDITLQDAIRTGLCNSRVLLDLGGTVLRSPDNLQTNYGIAVTETDPQFGVEGALSAFDAVFKSSIYSQKTDQQYNNLALGTNGLLVQNYDEWDTSITKTGVTGGQFTIRSTADYMRDTNAADIFPSGAFDTTISGEVRQPLLQGSGVEYNRIAGPGAKPGVYNGVLVARIRTDISAADFQAGLRDFVANVENAYWDLYFAYRDLDVKIQARDEALETWRRVRALNLAGGGARKGGEADKEAQAREQYFRFQADVENALMGYPDEGTRTYNGTAPGTFRALPGVQLAERRLRLIMGLPATGQELLRPADEPTMAPITFDWSSLSVEALFRREELRRQRWLIKSRELELTASQNFLKPNLDFDARYGLRGFGKDLTLNEPGDQSAYSNLFATEHQEWQVGLEFSMPLGFRQGNAAVRNSELRISQARAVLREGERTVVNQLSEAVAEVDRAYALLQNDIYRTKAAKDQLAALEAVYQAKQEGFFEVLDAQRRLSEAISQYYQSRVQYAVAIRNVHYQKGSLLDYCEVCLAEGEWPDKAYHDAMRRAEHRGDEKSIDYAFAPPHVVSAGTEAQILGGAAASVPVQPGPVQQGPAQPGPAQPIPQPGGPEPIPSPAPTPEQMLAPPGPAASAASRST